MIDPKDGGVASRKLWLIIGAMGLCFAGAALAARWPAFEPSYGTLVGGIVALASLYCGANLGHKWVMTKQKKPKGKTGDQADTQRVDPPGDG
jgi:hypothetical protein